MPVRPMTDEEAELIFGGGLVIFGQKRPQPLSKNSTQDSSIQANSGSAKGENERTDKRTEEVRKKGQQKPGVKIHR
jgi:hypothetical protein